MSRSVRRIAVALLLGAALAPGLALASPAAENRGATAALGLSWETLGTIWHWLIGVRPDEGSSSDPYGVHCTSGSAAGKGAVAGSSARRVRTTEGCSSDPFGRCNSGT